MVGAVPGRKLSFHGTSVPFKASSETQKNHSTVSVCDGILFRGIIRQSGVLAWKRRFLRHVASSVWCFSLSHKQNELKVRQWRLFWNYWGTTCRRWDVKIAMSRNIGGDLGKKGRLSVRNWMIRGNCIMDEWVENIGDWWHTWHSPIGIRIDHGIRSISLSTRSTASWTIL